MSSQAGQTALNAAVSPEPAAEVFPAARYFQIHFEFLQEQLQSILRNQQAMQERLQQLESRLPVSGQREIFSVGLLERFAGARPLALDGEAGGFEQSGRR